MLLPAYRGGGLYRAFFTEREAHARALGKRISVFCAVQRPADHPLRPQAYQPLEPVWQHFGYVPQPDLVSEFEWKDIDQPVATAKPMGFYRKLLSSRGP